MERRKYNLAEFLMCLKTQTHFSHLVSKKYSEHKALEYIYDNIDVDTILEVHISFTPILPFSCKVETITDHIKYYTDKRSELILIRSSFPQTEMQNLLDELLAVLDKGIYLLNLQ